MNRISTATIAFLAAMALAAPAYAQGLGGLGDKETPMQKQEKRKEEERKAIEQDYDKAMKRLKGQAPTQTSTSDPWAIVRPTAAETKNDTKKR